MSDFKPYISSIYGRGNLSPEDENVKYFALAAVFVLGLLLLDIIKVLGIILMIVSSVMYILMKVLNWNKVEEDGVLENHFILRENFIEIGAESYVLSEIESLTFFIDVIRGNKEMRISGQEFQGVLVKSGTTNSMTFNYQERKIRACFLIDSNENLKSLIDVLAYYKKEQIEFSCHGSLAKLAEA